MGTWWQELKEDWVDVFPPKRKVIFTPIKAYLCAKCGHNSAFGPYYRSDRDRLEFTCNRCQYQWDQKPLDLLVKEIV